MNQLDRGQPPIIIVRGPGAHTEVVAHTQNVLNHFGIAFEEMDWGDFPGFLASGAPGLRVVIFATGVAYTDEHLALPADFTVPVVRVVTDSAPPPEQLLKAAALSATTGFGVQGAVNAGLFAVRILAIEDATLRDLLKTKPYPAL